MIPNLQVGFQTLIKSISRTKQIDSADSLKTPLKRCLTTLDLTLLGIGNMAGSGIYVLTGTVIHDKAGPAAFLSYMIAGGTALLNALCYAELGSRIPKAGSAYTYTYISGGEFLAFVIGWSVILEYVLSVASVARGWSATVDTMVHKAIRNGTMESIGTFPQGEWLSEYPDLVAFAVVIVLGSFLAAGPKLSAMLNSVVTTLNLLVIILATSIMLSHPYNGGKDFAPTGFFPHGFTGVIAGAGTCFYSFIGFDAITISSEEAANPKKSMPIAVAISVSFVTFLFVLSSLALPLFVPWQQIDREAAFTAALRFRGINWATYITGIGSMLGISASLFTSMYAMPRIAYAMAQDGLIPQIIGYVLPSTQTPVIALAIFGLLAAILALLFDIKTLADFLSIGTLMAYTIVCASVIILRYRRPQLYSEYTSIDETNEQNTSTNEKQALDEESWRDRIGKLKHTYRNFPILRNLEPGEAPLAAMVAMIILSACMCSLVLVGTQYLSEFRVWAWLILIVLILGVIMCIFVLLIHEQNKNFDTFKVPFVPLIPCLSILLNITLIVKLSPMTWLRFFIWLAFGLIIYFGYGISHSVQGKEDQKQKDASEMESTRIAQENQPSYDAIEDKQEGRIE